MKREPQAGKKRRGPRLPSRGADGADLTLIRWMLSLTPAERLRAVQDSSRSLLKLRAGRTKVWR